MSGHPTSDAELALIMMDDERYSEEERDCIALDLLVAIARGATDVPDRNAAIAACEWRLLMGIEYRNALIVPPKED